MHSQSKKTVIVFGFFLFLLLRTLCACSQQTEPDQNPLGSAVSHQNVSDDSEHDHSDHADHDSHSEPEHDDHKDVHAEEELDHSDHADHDSHSEPEHDDHKDVHAEEELDHSDHADEDTIIKLSQEELDTIDITTGSAGPGRLKTDIHLQGEIRLNADRTARITPKVPGVAREVLKVLGDSVSTGEPLAVLESKELAEARASFHAALERLGLARTNHTREKKLWQQKISSEQEYLDAEQALAEARIELHTAEERLIALGFSQEYLRKLPHDPDEALAEYNLVAPFDGSVIEKNITLGEVLADDTIAFVIADLSTVWVDLSVYQKDLPYIKKGQKVIISAGTGLPDTIGTIHYVGPILEDKTRKTLARVILANNDGLWRPGLFVTARISDEADTVSILIPKETIHTIEGANCVFVKDSDGFRPQRVSVGRVDRKNAEILSGLRAGQRFVINGSFDLKAKLVTSSLDSHAGHGH